MSPVRGNYIVTGGSQGVGEAIVRKIAEAMAAKIVIIGRDRAKGKEAASRLSTQTCRVTFLQVELGDADQTVSAFAKAADRLTTVDGLVNAAGMTNRGSVESGALEDWDVLFNVNTRAPYLLMQAMIGHAKARGAPASIVNILSMNAFCGRPNLAIYAASKAALLTLTKNAANAHVADRIRVNGIAMGWAATPAELNVQAETEQRDAEWIVRAATALPLGRLLTVEEVARNAAFLLGDECGLLTGNILELEQWVRGAPPGR